MIDFLLSKRAKLIVIACNTITVSCLDKLRLAYPALPIIGTVPVVKTAAAITHNKRIGILSTTATANSAYQKALIAQFANGCSVFNHGTDALVPLIEAGELEGKRIEDALQNVLRRFQEEQIDTLALGCTHFPFLRTQIQAILGAGVQVLDSAAAIARQIKRILEHNKIVTSAQEATHQFYTTGDLNVAKKLLQTTIEGKDMHTFSKVTI
jgi:glutamate racemase